MRKPQHRPINPATLFDLQGQVALVTSGIGGLGRPLTVGLSPLSLVWLRSRQETFANAG